MTKRTKLLILASVCLLVIVGIAVIFIVCNGYKKVQSVTYGGKTIESEFYFEIKTVWLSAEEISKLEKSKIIDMPKYDLSYGKINFDGEIKAKINYGEWEGVYGDPGMTVKDLKDLEGTTIYYQNEYGDYCKASYDKLIISYVKVKQNNDGTLTFKYRDKENNIVKLKVKSDNYVINYFYK